jgi:hypothetical protein
MEADFGYGESTFAQLYLLSEGGSTRADLSLAAKMSQGEWYVFGVRSQQRVASNS